MILWWDKTRQYHLEGKQGVHQSYTYILPHVSSFVCTFKTSDGMIMHTLGGYVQSGVYFVGSSTHDDGCVADIIQQYCIGSILS